MSNRCKTAIFVSALTLFSAQAFCGDKTKNTTATEAKAAPIAEENIKMGVPLNQAESTGSAAETKAVASLKAKLDAMQSLSGRFAQTLKDKAGAVVQKSGGSFSVLRPDYFLWQTEAPNEQTVIGTPEKVWVYDPDLEQVTIQRRTPEQKNNPASLLAGDVEHIRETFDVTESSASGASIYDLKPLKDQTSYKTLQFVFSGNTLQRINFVDKLQQSTNIEFSQLKINPELKKESFNFTPPKGTDVIVDE